MRVHPLKPTPPEHGVVLPMGVFEKVDCLRNGCIKEVDDGWMWATSERHRVWPSRYTNTGRALLLGFPHVCVVDQCHDRGGTPSCDLLVQVGVRRYDTSFGVLRSSLQWSLQCFGRFQVGFAGIAGPLFRIIALTYLVVPEALHPPQ